MALTFPAGATEGDFYDVSPGRRYRLQNGRWQMWTNNQPTTINSPSNPVPPIYSDVAPDPNSTLNPYWYDTLNACLMTVFNDGTKKQWVRV